MVYWLVLLQVKLTESESHVLLIGYVTGKTLDEPESHVLLIGSVTGKTLTEPESHVLAAVAGIIFAKSDVRNRRYFADLG